MLTRRCTLAGLAGAAALAARPARAQSKGLVAVSMPTKIMARWIADGDNIVSVLKARGYDTDLQYGDDDVPNQVAQLENVITKGAKVLVIAAIDGSTLTDVLAKAAGSGIKVIAYDRLIRNTPNVDYYATFDNFQVGVEQGRSLIQGMSARGGTGPKNVELFGGSPDDNNAFFFYDGAMSVLQPLIDGKQITVPSGQVGMGKVATLRWDGGVAQSRMDNLLSAYYNDRRLDGVLAPNDGVSIGIISSVKGVGYGSADLPMPTITGQDCEVPSVKAIIRGDQYSSIFKDTRELARVTADMVDAMLSGKTVPVNNTTSYNNGAKVVPAYLLKPAVVTKENWRQQLVDSGYYKVTQFQ